MLLHFALFCAHADLLHAKIELHGAHFLRLRNSTTHLHVAALCPLLCTCRFAACKNRVAWRTFSPAQKQYHTPPCCCTLPSFVHMQICCMQKSSCMAHIFSGSEAVPHTSMLLHFALFCAHADLLHAKIELHGAYFLRLRNSTTHRQRMMYFRTKTVSSPGSACRYARLSSQGTRG